MGCHGNDTVHGNPPRLNMSSSSAQYANDHAHDATGYQNDIGNDIDTINTSVGSDCKKDEQRARLSRTKTHQSAPAPESTAISVPGTGQQLTPSEKFTSHQQAESRTRTARTQTSHCHVCPLSTDASDMRNHAVCFSCQHGHSFVRDPPARRLAA